MRIPDAGGQPGRLVSRACMASGGGLIARLPEICDDPIVALDEGGRPVWRNPAMDRCLEALGAPGDMSLLARIAADAAKIAPACASSALAVEETTGGGDGTIMLVGADGRQVWFTVSRIESEGEGTVVILHDVTAIKHREQNLVEANSLIEHRLNHDPRTGLPNRRNLTARLKQALARQTEDRRVGVVVIELLRFSELTSLHGPDAASEVVQEVCFTLLESVTEQETVARTGSHEFVVVFEDCRDSADLETRAERIHHEMQVSVPLETGDYTVAVRMAVVLADSGKSRPEQLLMDPMVALHHPDIPQSNFIRVYDAAMRSQLENRARIFSELKHGIGNDEIEPFFQPQVRISDGAVIGLEVLARWRHPVRGLMPPGLFLGIAEDSGLLPAIDDVIMKKSIGALAGWRRAGHRELRISLNASGEALRDPTFTDRLKMELDRHDLTPEAASIEILESVLIEDEDDVAARTLETLKANGFHLELDDFGTGYASISTLITLKVDTVKLDRSLIKDLSTDGDSYNIVRSTLALASELNVETLAEGVENDAQMAILEGLNCQLAQGFGIAMPMPWADVEPWLAERAAMRPERRSIA